MTERLHFHFNALEKEMATHSSILAWRIPRTGEPGGLPSMGWQRVGHDRSNLAAAAAWGESGEGDGTLAHLPGKSHGQRSLGRLQSMGSRRVGHD